MTSSWATVVHGCTGGRSGAWSRSPATSGASPSTADGTARPSLRRQARNAVAVTSSQPVPTSQPASTSETKWTPSAIRVSPTTTTTATPTATAMRRRRGGTTGSSTSSTTPTQTVAASVCPLGNDGPPAVATGMSTIGRSRSTSCLSSGLSTAAPSPVTAT